MTKTYGPMSSGAGANFSETQWQQLWSSLQPTGVVLGTGGAMAVFADSTGMQVKVPSGTAVIQGFLFNDDAQETLAINAANPSNPRVDRVVVRRDLSAKTMDYVVKSGTAGANPSPPGLQRDSTIYEIALAQVLVGTGVATIGANVITDERFNPNVGGVVHPWRTAVICLHATRPVGAQPGTLIYEWDTGAIYSLANDGLTWVQMPAGTGSPGNSNPGDVATAGTASTGAKSDHTHGRETFGGPVTQNYGDAATTGSSSSVPHADHRHGMPSAPTFTGLSGYPGATGTGALVEQIGPTLNDPQITTVVPFSGTATQTLPTPVANQGKLRFYKAWGGGLTINSNAGSQIIAPGGTAAVASFAMNNGDSVTFYCDGTFWTAL